MNFWVNTKNCLICARENIATCQPRDPPQTPYLQELPPRRGTRRQRCDECLSEINWGTCCSKEEEWDMFTCCNDSKTGTREDVSIVTLAWLVCLQPVSNYQSIHQIFGQMPLLAFSLPFQIRGSLGRGSPTQTMPCHRCGCTPDHLFVIKCEIIQWKWKCFFFLPNSKWEKLKLNLDLLCCTLSHAGRVGKCKDDRNLVEAAKVIFASTLFQNSLMLYYKTYICPPSRFFSSHWNHCYAHLATWPPGHLYSSGHLLTWPCP